MNIVSMGGCYSPAAEVEGGGAPLTAQEVPPIPAGFTIRPVVDKGVSSDGGLLGGLRLLGTSLFG